MMTHADTDTEGDSSFEHAHLPVPPVEAESRPWRIALRSLLSLGMLAVLVWQLPDVSARDLVPDSRSTTPVWIGLAAITLISAHVVQTARWAEVIRALTDGRVPPFSDLLRYFFAGQFISHLLPSDLGGDVYRVRKLGLDLDRDYPLAFATVTLERITGWLVLPLMSITTILAVPAFRSLGNRTTVALAISAGVWLALISAMSIAGMDRWARDEPADSAIPRYLHELHIGIVALRKHPNSALRIVAPGITFQALQCVALWMAARAINVGEVDVLACFAFFPIVAIVQNLPIGIGGLGVRETTMVAFFGALGTDKAAAISLGLLFYFLMIGTSALGVPALIGQKNSTRRSERARPAEQV